MVSETKFELRGPVAAIRFVLFLKEISLARRTGFKDIRLFFTFLFDS